MMAPVVPPDSAEPVSSDRPQDSTWIKLFLEDDQDLWRMLLVSFGSTRLSPSVSQKLGFGMTVVVFLFVMGLLMQVVESHETRAANETSNDDRLFVVIAEPGAIKPGQPPPPSSSQPAVWQPLIDLPVNDPNYSFGSIDSAASARVSTVSQPTRVVALAKNNAFTTAGGAAKGGFGGGAPGAPGVRRALAAKEAPLQVPETGSSILLLGLALFAMLGLNLLVKRRSDRTFRSR